MMTAQPVDTIQPITRSDTESMARTEYARMGAATKVSKAAGGPMIDALTAKQVADHADLSTDDLIARVDEIGPRAARWRAKASWVFRKMPMKEEVGDKTETWKMAFLLDTILTRDPWMHRIDIARATGRDVELTAEHDRRHSPAGFDARARLHGRLSSRAHGAGQPLRATHRNSLTASALWMAMAAVEPSVASAT